MRHTIRLFLNTVVGATLIELMIVTVITGILATAFLASFQEATTKAHLAKVKNDLRNITVACEMYKSVLGAYPTNIDSLRGFYFFQIPSSGTPDYSYVVDRYGVVYLLKDTNGNGKKDPEETEVYTFTRPEAFTCSSDNL